MNTTYILSKEELSEKLSGLLRWFDIEIGEENRIVLDPLGEQHTEICWSARISILGMFVGFLNCFHRQGFQDRWTVMRMDDPYCTMSKFSSHCTADLDEAVEYLVRKGKVTYKS